MTKFDKSKNTIYIDQDGVLADFDKFVLDNVGRTFVHQSGPSDEDLDMWNFLTTVERMYFQLLPMPHAKELWAAAHAIGCKVKILTAIPRRFPFPSAAADKLEWFEKHRDIFPGEIDFNIGPFSADKWKHAQPGDILIDDRDDNINDWETKGQGHGMLHNAESIPVILKVLDALKFV